MYGSERATAVGGAGVRQLACGSGGGEICGALVAAKWAGRRGVVEGEGWGERGWDAGGWG